LREERQRMVRERWMHLMLLGFALSIVVHVGIMLRLWAVKLPDREDNQSAAIELALQELPPTVVVVNDELEMPDPSPLVMGPVTTDLDPTPNLGSTEASGNPNENLWGAIEAPGIGAVAGPGGPGSGIGIGSGKGGGGTSFFGVGGRGTRFAYIVDVSGSMEQENRIVTALSELKRSLNALPDFTQFYVVLFSNGAIRPDFEMGGWLKATRANKNRMAQWIDLQGPRGGTYPHEAFDIVFKLPQPPDVIFFLTDGEIPGETNYHVHDLAAAMKREVIINTIGFSSEAGKDPLVQMARENRGVFRFVPTRGVGGNP
jgi:von Willebrand factor type A domain